MTPKTIPWEVIERDVDRHVKLIKRNKATLQLTSDLALMQHPPTETEWAQIQRRARAVMAEG